MRVIAGTAKGRTLKAPKGDSTRPFLDSVKESAFSILGGAVPGSVVLDLFAGSGSLAIEALSRGADRAVLVEKNARAISCLKINLEATGFASRGRVIRAPLPQALSRLEGQFDLVFVDPPYGRSLIRPVLEGLAERGLLSDRGVVMVHQPAREDLPNGIPNLCLVGKRVYGQATLGFYQPESGSAGRD